MFRIALVSFTLGVCGGDALACKERSFPSAYPLDEVDSYEHFYLARVETVEYKGTEDRYTPPFSFEATILSSFKGGAEKGQTIKGATGNEEAHAICSVDLREGETYLLMLSGDTMPYIVSRYSLIVGSSDEPFEEYLLQVNEAYGEQ